MKAALLVPLCAALASAEPALRPYPAPPSTAAGQMDEALGQLQDALADLPADVSRLAVHQIRFEPTEFRAGEMRYLQTRIEEVFTRGARRTVVNSPELRTLRVRATDTSFSVSNTLPGVDDLARLGEKLHVDAFVDGSCARSPGGDLLMAVRVYRARTGELVWSRTQISGPGRSEVGRSEVEFGAAIPLRILPVGKENGPEGEFRDGQYTSNIALEGRVTEIVTEGRWLALSLVAGYARFGYSGLPDSVAPVQLHVLHLGLETEAIFFRKPDPKSGYWLGTYAGYQEMVPALQRQHFGVFRAGYRSKPTRHFSLSAGILAVVYGDHMVDDPNTGGRTFDLDRIGYELDFLHYTF